MRKKAGCFFLLFLFLLNSCSIKGFSETQVSASTVPVLRGLLVGCDYFLSRDNTGPAAENNLSLLKNALLGDRRGYLVLETAMAQSFPEAEDLHALLLRTADGAAASDLFVFYICTHGSFIEGENGQEPAFLFCDGSREWTLGIGTLAAWMEEIPGTKVLIFDACFSGAFIGKGMADTLIANTPFTSAAYKVLTSAGGAEDSWYWKRDESTPGSREGASYFATMLSYALSGNGLADLDRDGQITLHEVYTWLLSNYAASTPHIYPQEEDGFPFFIPGESAQETPYVTDLTFDKDILSADRNTVSFSYTLRREAQVYYQLIYRKSGQWNFDEAQMFSDRELTGGDASPGRKLRSITLRSSYLDASGYIMLFILVRENGRALLQCSHLMVVEPLDGNNTLDIHVPTEMTFGSGAEMNIFIPHRKPCSMTLSIADAEGNCVRRLCYEVPSRPGISMFVWDGRGDDAAPVSPGLYQVQVIAQTSDTKLKIQSSWIHVTVLSSASSQRAQEKD